MSKGWAAGFLWPETNAGQLVRLVVFPSDWETPEVGIRLSLATATGKEVGSTRACSALT